MSLTNCAVTDGKFAFGWNDRQIELSGSQLRSHCRCAGCRADALSGVATPVFDDVRVNAVSPLGYGVQLHFSDGHNRGVFPWSYLLEIADDAES